MLQSTDNAPKTQFTPSTLNPVTPVKTMLHRSSKPPSDAPW